MKYTFKKIIVLAFGISLAIGASYISASYTAKPASAPSSNTDTPVNVTSAFQTKTGDISVNTFIVSKSSEFDKTLTLNGILTGNPISTGSTESNLSFGGQALNSSGSLVTRLVNLVIQSGSLNVKKTIAANNLINLTDPNNGVCADSSGTLVPCYEAAPDLCPNIAGIQATLPQNYTINALGQCVETDVCPNITGAQHTMPANTVYNASNQCVCATGYGNQAADGSCTSTTITGTVSIAPNLNFVYHWDYYGGERWVDPYMLTLNITSGVSVPVNFKWGYCTVAIRAGENNGVVGWPPVGNKECFGFDTYSSQNSLPTPYTDLRVYGYTVYGNQTLPVSAKINNIPDNGPILPNTTSLTSMVATSNGVPIMVNTFDSRIDPNSGYVKITDVIIYGVSLPTGYTLNLTPVVGSTFNLQIKP
ncbi:MAG: hypothetical protein WCQ32_00410 [bacterium]